MKKFIYILIFALSSTAVFTSCTEENITPSTTNTVPSGGGNGSTGL